jgi:hypothetical protein
LCTSRQQKVQRVLDNGKKLGFGENQFRAFPKDWQMVKDGAKRLPPGTFQLSGGRAHSDRVEAT